MQIIFKIIGRILENIGYCKKKIIRNQNEVLYETKYKSYGTNLFILLPFCAFIFSFSIFIIMFTVLQLLQLSTTIRSDCKKVIQRSAFKKPSIYCLGKIGFFIGKRKTNND